ncbi:nickel ABC transporter permease [Evansella clarkii]|jgi:peptide/nickel transport system permease protein|uniref:nickel ABC transporter permease n=1 Tax=Evansella clarkii TaxID=79879 RepID=UPI000B43E38A|nr:nickel ABC transporter permease [Evansella clarkii]
MGGLILKRFLQMLILLVGVSMIVFLSMHLAPGDPALIIAGPEAAKESVEQIRENLGLNDPLHLQYWNYISGVVQGDFGYSYQTSQDVGAALLIRFPNTLKLAIASVIVATLLGVTMGILSALRQNTWADYTSTTIALAGVSIPNFWLGAVLILIFSVTLQWLPVGGMNNPWYTTQGLKELVLPAITLGTASAAMIARMTRSAMLEVISSDYIRTARAKGTKERSIIMLHCFRNAMIPVVTLIGLNFGFLLGGTVIVEQVFAINGVGRLMINAIAQRDFPMVQGGVLLIAALFVFVNLIIDILYIFIDPRISYD